MNIIEIIENGNMNYDQAAVLFEKLTKEEILAMLRNELKHESRCNVMVDAGQFHFYSEAFPVKNVHFGEGWMIIRTGDFEITLDFENHYVKPNDEYDTSEEDYYQDIRDYIFDLTNSDGLKIGELTIEI